jgi:hypothetical protein
VSMRIVAYMLAKVCYESELPLVNGGFRQQRPYRQVDKSGRSMAQSILSRHSRRRLIADRITRGLCPLVPVLTLFFLDDRSNEQA